MEAVYRGPGWAGAHLVSGPGCGPATVGEPAFCNECHERIVVTDAGPNTLQHTRILLDEMEALGIDAEDVTRGAEPSRAL